VRLRIATLARARRLALMSFGTAGFEVRGVTTKQSYTTTASVDGDDCVRGDQWVACW
jgi:hypothetical protein